MWINGHFRRTLGFGQKQSYHIRCTFGFGGLQLVNSVLAKSISGNLSCRGQSCARCRESLASLCSDYVKITEESATLSASEKSGTVGLTLMTHTAGLIKWGGVRAKDIRCTARVATDAGSNLLAQTLLTFGFDFRL